MNKMLELIQGEHVPAPILKKAVSGQLALPVAEQLEILVFLTTRASFAAEAERTIAGWNLDELRQLCGDPGAPQSVLRYLALTDYEARSILLPALVANPSLDGETLSSIRNLKPELPEDDANAELQSTILAYEQEHSAEIAAEEGKRFELTRGHPDEHDEVAELLNSVSSDSEKNGTSATELKRNVASRPDEAERVSVLQKIAKLNVGARVQLAMKGNKDERFVLIRDGSRVVSLAVLESPKLTDSEVESFAAMKNVQEAVLRGIAAKRKFMKKYAVIKALVMNPKTPLDLGLNLVPHLLTIDLKNLSANKNVSETIRKLAGKMWHDRQKS